MGSPHKRKKPVKILDAEITDDGMIVIDMNVALPLGNSKKVILTPETLFALAEEYGAIPPAADTDYPGVPILEYEAVFPEDGEPDDGTEEENEETEQE